MKVPELVGVPLTVRTFEFHDALTPVGKPEGEPIPVAPVVVRVIGVKAVFIHNVGVEEAVPAVIFAVTIMVPVAGDVTHPPVKGIE